MAVERLPEHLRSRRTAEALTAPSAIVVAGAVAAVTILAGAPIAATAVLGVLGWGAAVTLRLPRRPRPLAHVDPHALRPPWSQYVQQALSARRRFDDVVGGVRPGPVHDRLVEIGGRLDAAVQECWRVASHGNALDAGVASLALSRVTARLDALKRNRPADADDADAWNRTVQALESQVASGTRLRQVAGDARNRVDVLDARLDEAVARAVELSLSAGDVSELSGLGDDVDALVGDMEALRQGLEEAGRAQQAGT